MVEFYKTARFEIDEGNFPLNHDCILKVCFIRGCPLRRCYFTCRAQDSGTLSVIFSALPLVSVVEISSVDDMPEHF